MILNAEIKEDIREECERFGEVVDMNIPRPTGGSRQSAGLGKVKATSLLMHPFPNFLLKSTDLRTLSYIGIGNQSPSRPSGEEVCG